MNEWCDDVYLNVFYVEAPMWRGKARQKIQDRGVTEAYHEAEVRVRQGITASIREADAALLLP